MNIDTTERDKKARRLMLGAANLAMTYSARKGLSGESLLDQVNGSMGWDRQIDADDCVKLARELEMVGYITIEGRPLHRGELFGLRHIELVRITEKGMRLLAEQLPVDPLVDDDRVEA